MGELPTRAALFENYGDAVEPAPSVLSDARD